MLSVHPAWSRRYCLPAAEQLKAFDVAEALERNVRKRDLKPTKSDLLSSVRATQCNNPQRSIHRTA